MKYFFNTLVVAVGLAIAGPAISASLVSDESIATQKKLTKQTKLKNGIPVTYREIPGSEILQLQVTFSHGLKDLPAGRKSLNEWLWTTSSMAAKGYPKEKLFGITEKYSLEIGCSGGIEVSACNLGTVNEYWEESLDLFQAVVRAPLLTEADLALTKDRIVNRLKQSPSDPGRYVNEVVNRIFYPKGHPYRLNHDEALVELEKLSRKDVVKLHQQVVNASSMRIVVVGSAPYAQVVKDLEKAFGGIKKGPVLDVKVEQPKFEAANSISFENRDIPTAYIRAKAVAPPVTDKDATALRFMFGVLDEELGQEIRTRRSLSYSVFAFPIMYTMGLGVVGASTSKPQETLAAMAEVIDRMKTKTFTAEELEEHKNVWVTAYFRTQETHAAMASAISNAMHYFGKTDQLYEMPRALAKVTPKDVQRLAKTYLKDFRIGVIFGKDNFDQNWAKSFVQSSASKTLN